MVRAEDAKASRVRVAWAASRIGIHDNSLGVESSMLRTNLPLTTDHISRSATDGHVSSDAASALAEAIVRVFAAVQGLQRAFLGHDANQAQEHIRGPDRALRCPGVSDIPIRCLRPESLGAGSCRTPH